MSVHCQAIFVVRSDQIDPEQSDPENRPDALERAE